MHIIIHNLIKCAKLFCKQLKVKVVYVRIILFRRESQSTDNVFKYKYLFSINYT